LAAGLRRTHGLYVAGLVRAGWESGPGPPVVCLLSVVACCIRFLRISARRSGSSRAAPWCIWTSRANAASASDSSGGWPETIRSSSSASRSSFMAPLPAGEVIVGVRGKEVPQARVGAELGGFHGSDFHVQCPSDLRACEPREAQGNDVTLGLRQLGHRGGEGVAQVALDG